MMMIGDEKRKKNFSNVAATTIINRYYRLVVAITFLSTICTLAYFDDENLIVEIIFISFQKFIRI